MDKSASRELLMRFEPILCFNRGERFFPMDPAAFVKRSSMWVRSPQDAPRQMMPSGSLSLDSLCDPSSPEEDRTFFLRCAEPLSATELARRKLDQIRKHRDPLDEFRAGRGRLARVGYASRLADVLFSLSLLARGRVPGDMATGAAVSYRTELNDPPRYTYCGRVLEQNDWIILQYWIFYAFNDWRSKFFGVNDHEGDWELVTLFLDGGGDSIGAPEWVVFSCHDYPGSDLLIPWEDPRVTKEGDHPVVFVGAGSHAGYPRQGDYLTEMEVPFMSPLTRPLELLRSAVRRAFRSYLGREETQAKPPPILTLPFVDYARGDGHALGPGRDRTWEEPRLIGDDTPWVSGFRGLWGLHAGDRLEGENAPAGPRYTRDGRVRLSWRDPLAWCGLTDTPPPSRRAEWAQTTRQTLESRLRQETERLDALRREALRVGAEREALAGMGHLDHRRRALEARSRELNEEIQSVQANVLEDEETLAALPVKGAPPADAPRREPAGPQPLSPQELRAGKLAEAWAAVSVSAMLLGFGALVYLGTEHWLMGAVLIALWFVLIEATFRGRLTRVLTALSTGAAILAAASLAIAYFQPLALSAVLGLGLYILWENLKELWT